MSNPASLSTLPLVCFNTILAVLVFLPVLALLGDGVRRIFSRSRAGTASRWDWEDVPGIGRLPVLRQH